MALLAQSRAKRGHAHFLKVISKSIRGGNSIFQGLREGHETPRDSQEQTPKHRVARDFK
jgi:hypothetical protein